MTGNEIYRERCGKIIKRVVGWASDNEWRIPEHYTSDWEPDMECNKENPDDQFKPYGATPGHGLEWARLIVQWALSTYKYDKEKVKAYITAAENLLKELLRMGGIQMVSLALYIQQTGMAVLLFMIECIGFLQKLLIQQQFFIILLITRSIMMIMLILWCI